jgi:hypothetical protein
MSMMAMHGLIMTSHVLLLWLVRHTSFWKTVRHTSTRTVLALVATWNLHCFCNRLTFEQCVWNARWSCKGKLTSRWFCWLAWTLIYPACFIQIPPSVSLQSHFQSWCWGVTICYLLSLTKYFVQEEMLRTRDICLLVCCAFLSSEERTAIIFKQIV